MNAWLKELETLLKKKLYQDEVEEIISFYQEMIEERLEKGESIDQILASYDMKKIVKDVTLDSVLKRDLGSYKNLSKSTKQILLLLVSTPLLLPLGIVYIAFIITAFSLLIAGIAVSISGIFGLIIYIIDLFQADLTFIDFIGILGIGIFSFSLLLLVALYLAKIVEVMFKVLLTWVTKFIKKGVTSREMD